MSDCTESIWKEKTDILSEKFYQIWNDWPEFLNSIRADSVWVTKVSYRPLPPWMGDHKQGFQHLVPSLLPWSSVTTKNYLNTNFFTLCAIFTKKYTIARTAKNTYKFKKRHQYKNINRFQVSAFTLERTIQQLPSLDSNLSWVNCCHFYCSHTETCSFVLRVATISQCHLNYSVKQMDSETDWQKTNDSYLSTPKRVFVCGDTDVWTSSCLSCLDNQYGFIWLLV